VILDEVLVDLDVLFWILSPRAVDPVLIDCAPIAPERSAITVL
jgi:hypothetical protein